MGRQGGLPSLEFLLSTACYYRGSAGCFNLGYQVEDL